VGVVEQARAVRQEDAFDARAVHRWLCEHAPHERGVVDADAPPEVRQFTGGASNLTYLLRYPERELILRRPPAGTKAASAHDMAREFRIQGSLRAVYPYVPRMVALCRDPAVIGSDFYVMERVRGTILRSRIPPELGLDAAATRRLCISAIERLVELHSIDPRAAGLDQIGRGPGYVRRQVEGWSQRYRAARTWNVPRCERTMRWLAERQPKDVAQRVIHNDFRLDNLVLSPEDPQRIMAVLDWEMATVGDPLMDLGGSLAYWVQADDDRVMRAALRRQPSDAPGMLSRREIVEHYALRTGVPVESWSFYEVFGLFRLATIIQQIYRRYHLRQTRNPAFRHYWLAVHYLDRRCRRIMRRGQRTARGGGQRTASRSQHCLHAFEAARSQSKEPRSQSDEPRSQSQAPRSQSEEPRSQSQAPRSQSELGQGHTPQPAPARDEARRPSGSPSEGRSHSRARWVR
jgi:aminoglycoside phosphotransferase (APT) family kinase protein